MADDVGTLVQNAANVLTLGIIPGAGAKKAATPAISREKPLEMPMPNDAAAKTAKRKSIAAQVARKGRASTILTQNETLG